MNSIEFTHEAAEKRCPSCWEPYLLAGGYFFCEREHGTRKPMLERSKLPVATRTAMAGRFTIAGKEGFWKMPSHMHKEFLHYGPPEGSVVASIVRFGAFTPVAVVFVRGKSPERKSKKKPGRAFAEALEAARKGPAGPAIIAKRISGCVIGCSRKFKSRGLCEVCYREAMRAIRKYETTWGELEDYGLAVKGREKPMGRQA